MKNEIILTVAVTTYNRVRFLETALDHCIKQIQLAGLEKEVEILISNDASPDKDTPEYVTKVDKEFTFVRGFNQPKNIGVSKNLEWIVNESKGTHILLHGDDDIIQDGAIAYFVKVIKERKPNFIIINTNNIHSLDDSNREYKVVKENRLNINKDIFMENFEKNSNVLKSANDWLYMTNFITANIFRKDLWQKEMENALKFVKPKNVFLWQAPLIIGIKKYGKLLLVADCFILCRKNPTDNYILDPRGLYYINLYESIEISRLIKEYMPLEYKNHKKIYSAFIMSSFITELQRGKKISKYALIAFYRYFDCFPENIQFLAMAIAPNFVVHFASKLRYIKRMIVKIT
jgi:hypothetical protein